MTSSEADIARWMVNEVVRRRNAYQVDIVAGIASRFGDEWVDATRRGRSAIAPAVRRRFRIEHGGAVHWDPFGRSWHVASR